MDFIRFGLCNNFCWFILYCFFRLLGKLNISIYSHYRPKITLATYCPLISSSQHTIFVGTIVPLAWASWDPCTVFTLKQRIQCCKKYTYILNMKLNLKQMLKKMCRRALNDYFAQTIKKQHNKILISTVSFSQESCNRFLCLRPFGRQRELFSTGVEWEFSLCYTGI